MMFERLLYYTLLARAGEPGVLEWWEYERRRHEHVLFRRTLRLGLREVPVARVRLFRWYQWAPSLHILHGAVVCL